MADSWHPRIARIVQIFQRCAVNDVGDKRCAAGKKLFWGRDPRVGPSRTCHLATAGLPKVGLAVDAIPLGLEEARFRIRDWLLVDRDQNG